ncbi:MAG: secretin N-terminal domain-containing protein [Candidatus Margulisiibacteriota bacterium]
MKIWHVGLLVVVSLFAWTQADALFLQTAPAGEASGAPAPAAAPPSASYAMQSYTLKYANAKELKETLSGILGQGEGIAVNEKLNAIILRASDANIKRVSALIKKLDIAPLQVQVEAKIIELKTGNGDTNNPSVIGAEWKYTKNTNNYVQLLTDASTAGASSLGLYAQLLSGNTEAFLTALEKTVGYDLVASPWVTALNHEEAEILIGSKYGYKTTLTTTTGTMQNIEFLEVGTKLKFTPHINEDGYVVMEVAPSISEGQVKNDLPSEDTTETKNKVLVKDGQSILIGGLTKNYERETEMGIPVLSAIPFIGNLFRRTELQSEKRDLMVIITPHIVTPEFLEAMHKRAVELEARRGRWSDEKGKLIH